MLLRAARAPASPAPRRRLALGLIGAAGPAPTLGHALTGAHRGTEKAVGVPQSGGCASSAISRAIR